VKRSWAREEIVITIFYFLILGLVLIPYYNWLYRVLVNFLHGVLFCISLLIIALVLFRCIRRACFERMSLALVLGLLVLFAGSQVHRWRYSITRMYIRSRYCGEHSAEDRILGGIVEIKVEGVERTGVFENRSHCLFVPCPEEFYYCDDATLVIGR